MPVSIDLNVALSCSNDDEASSHMPELEITSTEQQTLLSSCDIQFNLNQCSSVVPFDLNEEAPCEEEVAITEPDVVVHEQSYVTETEVILHEPQVPETDSIQSSKTDDDVEEPMETLEVEESQSMFTCAGSTSASEYHGTCNERNFLSNEDRKAISHLLLQHSSDGKLKRGATKLVASMYSVSESVVKRIWRRTNATGDASHRKTRNCGRKRVHFDDAQFRQVPLSNRTTLRDLARALNINKTSLIKLQRNGVIRRHTNAIKSYLKEENKIARLKFCLSMLESGSILDDPTFKSMHNIVHIDEKWFYMTKKSMNYYYLLLEEEEPLHSC